MWPTLLYASFIDSIYAKSSVFYNILFKVIETNLGIFPIDKNLTSYEEPSRA